MKLAVPEYSIPIWSVPRLCLPELWLPEQASNPSPADDATNVYLDTNLSWSAADRATSYDVLFGLGTGSLTVVSANQTGTSYDIPISLLAFTDYYWRIDSKNSEGTTTGNVWIFTTSSDVQNDYPNIGRLVFQTRFDEYSGRNKDARNFLRDFKMCVERDFFEIAKRVNWLIDNNFTQHPS